MDDGLAVTWRLESNNERITITDETTEKNTTIAVFCIARLDILGTNPTNFHCGNDKNL